MKISVSLSDFRDAFHQAGRAENFSYAGLEVLFDYLEEYESSCDVELELDVVALCCEYSEDHYTDVADYYNIEIDDLDPDDEDAFQTAVVEYLEEHTSVVGVVGESIIYQAF